MASSNIDKTAVRAPEDLIIVGLDTDDSMDHAMADERVNYDIDPAFVENIIVMGVLLPVSVREQDGKLFVVDGRQRVMAAREANRRLAEMGVSDRVSVPVTTHGNIGANDTMIAAKIISANNFRRDDDVLVKAQKAQRLFRLNGSLEETAVACGVSTATLNNWFKLNSADAMLHNAIRQDKITLSAAYYLCTHFPVAQQRDVLMNLLKRIGGLRINDVFVKNYHNELKGAATYDPTKGILNDDDDSEELESAAGKLDSGAFADGFDPDSDDPLPPDEDDGIKKTSSGKSKTVTGVSKVWLKKALASEFAENLNEDQRGVLYWMANGFNEDSSYVGWWNEFHVNVVKEFKEKKMKKKKKGESNDA